MKDVKSIGWKELISGSFRFCVNPKAILPILIVNAIVFGITAYGGTFAGLSDAQALSYLATEDLMNIGLFVTAIMVFTWIVGPFVSGAVIYFSRNTGKYSESWKVAFSRIIPIVLASVVIMAVLVLLAMIPVAGIVFAWLASVAFMFTLQVVIFEGSGFYNALRTSAWTFRKRPGVVLAGWITDKVISTAIYGIFMAPFVFVVFSSGIYAAPDMDYMSLSSLGSVFYIALFSLLLGATLNTVFELKFFTEFYFQLKKKKWVF